MYLPKSVFDFGFVFYVLHNGGHLYPLEIGNLQDYGLKGWNCMNPSVMFFGGKLYFSVRCVNYTLFNSDYFPVEGQPTIYCETEGNLRTVNFIGTLDANNGYAMKDVGKVDTSKCDVRPLWHFIGLEDARLIPWENRISLSGVRRDFQKDGCGRMEISHIEKTDKGWMETGRKRIPLPRDEDSYCEKNWMPFMDKDGLFLRNVSRNEIIDCSGKSMKMETGFALPEHLRGDSQIVRLSEDGYIGVVHECRIDVMDKKSNARTGEYRHRFILLDNDGKITGCSRSFHYSNDFNIEFGCGLAVHGDNILISFSEMDLSAFLLVFNRKLLNL